MSNEDNESKPTQHEWVLADGTNNIYRLSLSEPVKCLIYIVATTRKDIQIVPGPFGTHSQTETTVLDPLTEGVEALGIAGRYTFIVQVGRVFKPEVVLQNLLRDLQIENLWKVS
jgi:hypothetical protein